MRTKLLLSLAVLLLLPVRWCGAQTIAYDYDASGNRIVRRIIPLNSFKALTDTSGNLKKDNDKVFKDNLGEQKISIYPNPTQGQLKIDISGFDFSERSSVYIFSPSGTLLIQQAPATASNIVDLSSYPSGAYILKIALGNKTSEWKIIKE